MTKIPTIPAAPPHCLAFLAKMAIFYLVLPMLCILLFLFLARQAGAQTPHAPYVLEFNCAVVRIVWSPSPLDRDLRGTFANVTIRRDFTGETWGLFLPYEQSLGGVDYWSTAWFPPVTGVYTITEGHAAGTALSNVPLTKWIICHRVYLSVMKWGR